MVRVPRLRGRRVQKYCPGQSGLVQGEPIVALPSPALHRHQRQVHGGPGQAATQPQEQLPQQHPQAAAAAQTTAGSLPQRGSALSRYCFWCCQTRETLRIQAKEASRRLRSCTFCASEICAEHRWPKWHPTTVIWDGPPVQQPGYLYRESTHTSSEPHAAPTAIPRRLPFSLCAWSSRPHCESTISVHQPCLALAATTTDATTDASPVGVPELSTCPKPTSQPNHLYCGSSALGCRPQSTLHVVQHAVSTRRCAAGCTRAASNRRTTTRLAEVLLLPGLPQ